MGSGQLLEVVPLDASEFGRAGKMLGRAFQTDPLWTAVIPDSVRRKELLVGMFTAFIRTTVVAQGLAEKTRDLEGVALWLPPEKDAGLWAMVRSGFAIPRLVMRLPEPDRKRMMAAHRELGKRREALMPEPHWYLSVIGVEHESQGMGLGSVLVKHGIARADRGEVPIYLETASEGNISFYQKLGFDVIEESTPKGVDVQMWSMARHGTFPHP